MRHLLSLALTLTLNSLTMLWHAPEEATFCTASTGAAQVLQRCMRKEDKTTILKAIQQTANAQYGNSTQHTQRMYFFTSTAQLITCC